MTLSDLGMIWWILDGHTPRLVGWDEYLAWQKAGSPDNRRVAQDTLGDVWVSTVFLTVDHAFLGGPPILFETMIFGGPHDQLCWRYATWEGAEAGHRRVVAHLRAGTDPDEDIA